MSEQAQIEHPLQFVRINNGWTQEKLAREVRARARHRGVNLATSAKTVAKWEHGVEPEKIAKIALAELLGISEGVVNIVSWPDWLPRGSIPGADREWGTPGEAIEALREVVETPFMDRRGFLVLSGASLLAPVYEWMTKRVMESLASARGLRVSLEEMESMSASSQAIRLMSEKAGSGVVRNMAHANLELALSLLRSCSYSEEVAKRLYDWAAEAAQLAGFNSFDLNDQASAQRYYTVALRLAHMAGDVSLGANVVGFMSYQCFSRGHLSDAQRLAELGLENLRRSGKGSPKVHAMLAGRAALVAGKVGDSKKCALATDEALSALDRSAVEPEPRFTSWIDDGHVNGVVGRAFLHLGDDVKAETHLAKATNPVHNHTRSRALYLEQMARVGFLRRDMDYVWVHGREAWEVVSKIQSRRVLRGVKNLAVELEHHGASREAREFSNLLQQSVA